MLMKSLPGIARCQVFVDGGAKLITQGYFLQMQYQPFQKKKLVFL